MLPRFVDRLPVPYNIQLVALRLLSQWRAQLILFVGVLLVAMIGTNIRLYTSAIAQIGLVERLQQESPENVHLYIRTSINPEETLDAQWQATHEIITETVAPLLDVSDGWVEQFLQGVETLAIPAQDADGTRLSSNLRLAYYDDLEAHIDVLEGEFPPPSTDEITHVAISMIAASRLNLEVGDSVTLRDVRESSLPITLRISAIITESDVQEAYMFTPSPLRVGNDGESNLFVTRDEFRHLVQDFIPDVRVQANWRVLFDYQRLPIDRIAIASQQLNTVETDLSDMLVNPVITGNAAPILNSYSQETSNLGTPIALLLIQVGLLVLLFLIVIASLIWRGEIQEISLFQTRGARLKQILFSRGIEIAVVCVLAMLVAPLLAYSLLTQLLPRIMNVESVVLTIEADTYVLSIIASVIAWLVMMFSVTPILNASLRMKRNTGAKKVAWWYRYYLDIGLLILIIAELMRLLESSTARTVTNDPLLLLTPTLLFAAVGGILLRVFPIVMRLLAGFVGQLPGLSRALAMWQISRESSHYVRIIFLLSLAISIGWFATSFRSTFSRNLRDSAQYAIGTDIRLPVNNHVVTSTHDNFAEAYLSIPGVESVTHVIRDDKIRPVIQRVSTDSGEALFVNHNDIIQTGVLRDDLGAMPAPTTDGTQFSYDITGSEFPATPQSLTLEWKLDFEYFQRNGQQFTVHEINGLFYLLSLPITATLSDEYGNSEEIHFEIHHESGVDADLFTAMSEVSTSDLQMNTDILQSYLDQVQDIDPWVLLQAQLPEDSNLSGTISLESLNVYNWTQPFLTMNLALHLRNLELFDTAGTITKLDWLSENVWSVTDSAVNLEITGDEQIYSWTQGNRRNANAFNFRSLNNYPPQVALPVVASTSFLELNNLELGNEFELFVAGQSRTFVIVDETTYYPTLYGQERPFFVGDIATLLYDDLRRGAPSNYGAEIWIKLAEDSDVEAVMQEIRLLDDATASEALVFSRVRDTLANDVLALGLIGLLFLAFLIVLLLSIISLIAFSWLNARQRQGEFAYLLALGIPPSRITLSLVLEQVLIMLSSGILGAGLGIFLSQMVLPVLANSVSQKPAVPPFFIQTEVGALLQYGVILVGILVVVMAMTIRIISHLSLSQTLRVGEE